MGNLRVTDQGLKLYGDAEFVEELHAKLIRSRQVNFCFVLVMVRCYESAALQAKQHKM